MYADQVIEAMKSFRAYDPRKAARYSERTKTVQADIRNSQKFFVGDMRDVFNSFGLNKSGQPFMDVSDLRLPFSQCWFGYTLPVEFFTDMGRVAVNDRDVYTKGCILAHQVASDIMLVEGFLFYPQTHSWTMVPSASFVSVNKNLKDCLMWREICSSFYANDNGLGYALSWDWNIYPLPWGDDVSQDFLNDMVKPTRGDLMILETALKLLDCQNVGTETVTPDLAINKKRRKAGKTELFTYHTLVLKPMGKRQESIPKHLWENRIHLARGHFKTYTADKPLFGRITGRFWWQAHVRGRNRNGVVMKDYDVSQLSKEGGSPS